MSLIVITTAISCAYYAPATWVRLIVKLNNLRDNHRSCVDIMLILHKPTVT